jgi:hypothetical protein
LVAGLLGVACATPAEQTEPEDLVGNTSLAIVQIPSGVACLRITATSTAGSRVVRTLNVAGGAAYRHLLNGLPLGNVTFVGEAFTSACAGVDNLSVPEWITDPIAQSVAVNGSPDLCLVFTPNGRSRFCADFQTSTVSSVSLTSVTLDPEDVTGVTTNAPGAWSSGQGDPLSQVGVVFDGQFLNIGADASVLGEISIPLHYGLSTYTFVGNGVFAGNTHYGAVLFFNGVAVYPQIAVYNRNAVAGAFSVQAADAAIMGGANGGVFFDQAPGTAVFTAADGTRVEVVGYTIDATSGTRDLVSWGGIGADGVGDTVATLTLRVTPPNCP